MKRVTGIGGIFFKSNDQEKLYHRTKSMINYRVDDLDALLRALKEEGVEIDPHREDYDYGRFAWVMDPDRNRIELWEPPKDSKG
jgi:predicted enzyme related to lactoylglutathione lyase